MNYKIVRAKDFTDVKDFVCGVRELDSHRMYWEDYSIHHIAVFYFVKEVPSNELVAAFALRNDSLVLDEDDKDDMRAGIAPSPIMHSRSFKDIFYNFKSYPAIELSLLVVSKRHQRCGLGRCLINEIIHIIRSHSFSGCIFMTVDAIAKHGYSTVGFYNKLGFCNCTPVPVGGIQRMYIPLTSNAG